uniref:Protein YIP n=1 Tax=Zea mays TaxID=4577 RepID=A0A804Q351_MAIZE
MDEGYSNLPTSHLLGSVPAVTQDDRKLGPPAAQAATSRLQEFPPGGGNVGGYRPPGGPADGDVENQADWKGYFNVASYAPYFNVDTDVVVDRLISSVYPMDGFYRKIDANPDMYGPLWITTTLIFMLAVFGNYATYLYFGSRPSLVRFWCMWGYSLFIFIPASVLLLIPVGFLQWVIIALAGGASSWFITLNLKECTEGADLMVLMASASVLQFALALFIKVYFFA